MAVKALVEEAVASLRQDRHSRQQRRHHPPRRLLSNFSEKDWDDVMNINVKTVFFLSQAAAQPVRQAGQRRQNRQHRVDAFLSGRHPRAVVHRARNRASRASRCSLANEWAKYNINVNAIAPGYMATEQHRKRCATMRNAPAQILERIPAGRWGTPQDVAGAVCVPRRQEFRLHQRLYHRRRRRLARSLNNQTLALAGVFDYKMLKYRSTKACLSE
ncbi:MAG: SDR family oxidoreductase [Bacillus subtilis]|nr:SDR family oxidoreductase [Bacillus subtilis]